MRFLDQFKLLCNYLKLTIELIFSRSKCACLFIYLFKLRFARSEFRCKYLVFLSEIFCLSPDGIEFIGYLVILTLDFNIKLFFLGSCLFKIFISLSVHFVLLHHHIMISLQKFYHFVLLCFLKSQFLHICNLLSTSNP